MLSFDLHIHTTFSDGLLTPDNAEKELINHYGFKTVTDHDNPSYHLRENTNCSFTGIEITVYTKYFGIRLDKLGILSELLFYGFTRKTIPSIIEVINNNDNLEEVVSSLQQFKINGAKILLAHPYYCRRTDIDFKIMLDYYSQFVDGFECLHESCLNEEETIFLLDYCRKNNKIASGGSDSHGNSLKHRRFPANTPYLHLVELYPELFQWIPELTKRNDTKY